MVSRIPQKKTTHHVNLVYQIPFVYQIACVALYFKHLHERGLIYQSLLVVS